LPPEINCIFKDIFKDKKKTVKAERKTNRKNKTLICEKAITIVKAAAKNGNIIRKYRYCLYQKTFFERKIDFEKKPKNGSFIRIKKAKNNAAQAIPEAPKKASEENTGKRTINFNNKARKGLLVYMFFA
jgi:hypothetical protein